MDQRQQISGMILLGTNSNMNLKFTIKLLLNCVRNWKLSQGFTLIEIILYIAIVSIVVTSLVPFAWNVIGGGIKATTEREIYDNARYISEQIKYQIRNATGINSVSSSQISLVTANSATNPTVIAVSGNNMTMKQGTGSTIYLNSQNATVSAVTFTNYTSADNKTENIQFVFTVNAYYPGGGPRQEFNGSVTMEGDAEVRSNTN